MRASGSHSYQGGTGTAAAGTAGNHFLLPVFGKTTQTKQRHQAANKQQPESMTTSAVSAAAASTASTVATVPPSIITTTTSPNNSNAKTDDADAAAGERAHQPLLTPYPSNQHSHPTNAQQHYSSNISLSSLETAPTSVCTINTHNAGDLEFFEDLITEPVFKESPSQVPAVWVLGVDIAHYSRSTQFVVCATGVFFFSLLYGYLQELLSVELCSRQLGLFLAMMQFTGYTILAYILRRFVYTKQQKRQQQKHNVSLSYPNSTAAAVAQVPLALYLGLSLLRAVDLAMTNLAMQYINYPAKTLMKSSRVVFTMMFGVLIQRKTYKSVDYAIVLAMVAGLAMFMHADAHSSAVFHHMGVIMLTVSLVCDGAISNMSETIMSQFGVGQDEVCGIVFLAVAVFVSMHANNRSNGF